MKASKFVVAEVSQKSAFPTPTLIREKEIQFPTDIILARLEMPKSPALNHMKNGANEHMDEIEEPAYAILLVDEFNYQLHCSCDSGRKS